MDGWMDRWIERCLKVFDQKSSLEPLDEITGFVVGRQNCIFCVFFYMLMKR
jgi:hypothetical protein